MVIVFVHLPTHRRSEDCDERFNEGVKIIVFTIYSLSLDFQCLFKVEKHTQKRQSVSF